MLHRRDWFRLGAGAAALSVVGVGCNGGARSGVTPGMAPAGPVPGGHLDELSIAELGKRMASGEETAASLVAKYRQRIEQLNAAGPNLRAVLELDPDAPRDAEKLDAERKAGTVRGPLHGIPILVKDNLDTAGRTMTTAGSLALAGAPAPKDSTVVAKLRAAGAVILGKTNLSEWANIRGNPSTSGWSARGGQCKNPYVLDRSPCGSSSGSGAAVATSMCAAAIGTETDGSIVCPAAFMSHVGLKPTVGLVSRAGIVPISASQDTAGPMTRTVADAALVLAAIAGPDPADPVTANAKVEDYAKYLSTDALKGARLGVARKGYFGVNRNVDPLGEAALAALKKAGAVLVDPIDLAAPPELGAAELEVLLYELKAGMETYLATRGDPKLRSLADLVAFNQAHAAEELGLFGQELFEQAAAKGPLTDKAYVDARALCVKLARTEGLDKVMAAHQLDAIVTITGGPAWLVDPVNGDAFVGPSATSLPAVAGTPHITVPAGYVRGLPIGISLWGRAFEDGKLLGYAYAFEQATKHRRQPSFLRTAPG
jgi:amidase